jgi:hypothetical protein
MAQSAVLNSSNFLSNFFIFINNSNSASLESPSYSSPSCLT